MKKIRKWGLGFCISLLVVGQLACTGLGAAQSGPTARKYPPYPSVWDWAVPRGSHLADLLWVEKQQTGDVVIIYKVENPNLQPGQPRCRPYVLNECPTFAATFFSRESAAPSTSQRWLHGDHTIHLKDGVTIERIGLWGARRGCYHRQSATVLKKDRAGNIVERKKLLYVLDPPQRYLTRDDCYDGPPFVNRVDSIFADFLPLEDDTFLMIDHQHGVVVRFDAEFRSQSALLNRRLFVVDETTFNNWLRQMNFGSREDLNLNLQVQQDGLYRALTELKGRTQP